MKPAKSPREEPPPMKVTVTFSEGPEARRRSIEALKFLLREAERTGDRDLAAQIGLALPIDGE